MKDEEKHKSFTCAKCFSDIMMKSYSIKIFCRNFACEKKNVEKFDSKQSSVPNHEMSSILKFNKINKKEEKSNIKIYLLQCNFMLEREGETVQRSP